MKRYIYRVHDFRTNEDIFCCSTIEAADIFNNVMNLLPNSISYQQIYQHIANPGKPSILKKLSLNVVVDRVFDDRKSKNNKKKII